MRRPNPILVGASSALLAGSLLASCSGNAGKSPEQAGASASANQPPCTTEVVKALGKSIFQAGQHLQPPSVWSGGYSNSIGIDLRGKNAAGHDELLQVEAVSARSASSRANVYDPCSTDKITATITLMNANGQPSSPLTSYYYGIDTGYAHTLGTYPWQPTPGPSQSPNGEAVCGSDLTETSDPAVVAHALANLQAIAKVISQSSPELSTLPSGC